MTKTQLVGRDVEEKVLKELLNSKEAEFLAIYGRRRVGKTYLINTFFSDKGTYFEITGQKDGSLENQLENFISMLSKIFYGGIPLKVPKTWKEAFSLLNNQVESIPQSKKMIIFLDELPWLASKKSNLMQALDYYWNSHWSKKSKVILIVCGSAASWMLDYLINAKGGLYNRLTKVMHLKPYRLKQTQEFLNSRGIALKPLQILDLYMAFGGIPHYLKQVKKGKSASQNINEICFQKEGFLYGEFKRLFASLFDHSEIHEAIVRAIASKRNGISRDELIEMTKFSSGGTLNKRLKELEASSFIQSYIPLGKKKKDHYYRVSDEYVYFYLNWIEPLVERGVDGGKAHWRTQSRTQKVISWKGYAFESICLKHIDQIRTSLELDEIYCEVGSWRYLPKKGSSNLGAQIDLLFDREDGVITLCEIKYSDKIFSVGKDIAKQLVNKINVFEKYYPTDKQIFFTLITTKGMKQTIWSDELVQSEVVLDDLFLN